MLCSLSSQRRNPTLAPGSNADAAPFPPNRCCYESAGTAPFAAAAPAPAAPWWCFLGRYALMKGWRMAASGSMRLSGSSTVMRSSRSARSPIWARQAGRERRGRARECGGCCCYMAGQCAPYGRKAKGGTLSSSNNHNCFFVYIFVYLAYAARVTATLPIGIVCRYCCMLSAV